MRDAVFAAAVARLFQHAHVAEQVDLIEHEQCAAVECAIGLHHGLDQRADDHPSDARIRAQDGSRDVKEHILFARNDIAGSEGVAADETSVTVKRQPLRILRRRRVDAGKRLLRHVGENAERFADEVGLRILLNVAQHGEHRWLRLGNDLAQTAQSSPSGIFWREHHMRKQAGQQIVRLVLEVGAA